MKKILSFVISLILIVSSVACINVFAAGSPTGGSSGGGGGGGGSAGTNPDASVLEISSADVYKGGNTVTIKVSFEGRADSSMQYGGEVKAMILYDLSYDKDALEFVSGNVIASPKPIISNVDENGEIVFAYENNTDCDGEIAELTFKSKSKTGTFDIAYKCVIRSNEAGGVESEFHFDIDTPGKITVKNTSGGDSGGGGVSSYTVKFETDGGSTIKSQSISKNKTITEPTIPVKDGYTFDGWYTDEELTNKYDFTTKVTKSFTLYAKWIENIIETSEPDEKHSPFKDININDWFYNAVMFAYENNITKGISETEFAPLGKVTRGQFITMLCRAYEIPEMIGDNFDDCGDTWHTGYLAAAKQLGISNGVGDNKFAPEKEITREEMVTLIYNYLKSIGETSEIVNATSFTDDDMISEWAKSAVAFASSNGIAAGKDNNMFDPQGTATRAELAQIFFNIFVK